MSGERDYRPERGAPGQTPPIAGAGGATSPGKLTRVAAIDGAAVGSAVGQVKSPPTSSKADPIDLYLSVHETNIWQSVKAHLPGVPWPDAHRLVVWDNEKRFGLAVYEQLRADMSIEPDGLNKHLFPANYRDPLAPMIPSYTSAWLPGVGQAIAELFEDAARASLRRIGPRYAAVAQHDPKKIGSVTYSEILKSHPMDRPVAAALVVDGVAHYIPSADKADDLPAPRKLKDVHLDWLGDQDASLWNWVRATPGDATVEEVAAALYSKYDVHHGGESGSTMAYGLTAAPPLFGVPPSWAMQFAKARAHAPSTGTAATGDRSERVVALTSSKVGDEVALAQHRAAATKAPTPKAASLSTTLDDSLIAAMYLSRTLSPWNQAAATGAVVRWLIQKQHAIATMKPDELGTWGPIIDAQKARLLRIVAGVKQVVDRTSGLGVKDASSPSAKPIALVLAIYARAAAVSHLDDTCEQLLTEAGQQTQQLAITMLRGVTNDMDNAVSLASRANQRGAGEHVKQADQVATDSHRLQDELAAGTAVDAGTIQETTLHAQEIAFRTRVEGLFWSVRALRMSADKAGSGLASHIAAKFHGSFRTLEQALKPVEGALNEIVAQMLEQDQMVAGTWETPDDQREARRDYLTGNQKLLRKLTDSVDLVTFLKEGAETVQWQQFATACVQMAALIGVSIIAGAAGGMVTRLAESALVRVGSAEAVAEIAESGSVLARAGGIAGRAGARVLGAAADAGINAAGQVKIQGGEMGETFLTNLLSTIGSNAIFSTLSKDLEIARTVEMRTSNLWARAGKFVLKEAVTVSAHTVINVAVGYLAHMVVTHRSVTPMMAREWLLQGLSTGLGRYVGGFLKSRKPVYDKLGHLPESLGTRELVASSTELGALSSGAETHPSGEAATGLMTRNAQHMDREVRVLENIEKHPEILTAHPEARLTIKDVQAAIAAIKSQQAKIGPIARKLAIESAGLEEIVPNSEYRGSADQVRRAIEAAHAMGVEVGAPHTMDKITRIKIGDTEIMFHEGAPTETAPPRRTPEEQFLEDVREKLGPDEAAKFQEIIGRRTAKQVHDQFGGDVGKARQTIAKATAQVRAAREAEAVRLERIEDMRQWAKDFGLEKNPRVREIIDRYEAARKAAKTEPERNSARKMAAKDLRGLVIGAHVEGQLYLEFQNQPGRHHVRRDIQVWQAQDPMYKSVAEYKAAHPELFADSKRGVKMIDGRAHLEITDFDFLVTTGAKQDKVVHIEELKTGANDSATKAGEQITNGRDAVAEAARGGRPVKLLEGGKDVTAEFDLGSFGTAGTRTRGPAEAGAQQQTPPEKRFGKSLDLDARSLEEMARQLLEDWTQPPTPPGPTPPKDPT